MSELIPRETRPCQRAAEQLNRDCQCVSIEQRALEQTLGAGLDGAMSALLAERPHLFAQFSVFIGQADIDAMAAIVRAVEHVVALPAYQTAVAAWAPPIALTSPAAAGVFYGYDFHLTEDGPGLVEINTNAGGAMLNALLADAQRACCDEVQGACAVSLAAIEAQFIAMFRREWARVNSARELARIAIIDDAPTTQYLYPEFLLFQQLFRRHGIDARIVDVGELELRGDRLGVGDWSIDLVYNRVTDFDFEMPAHAVLRDAYLRNAAVITPHPRAHALYADKRNLILLTDAKQLQRWQVAPEVIDTLVRGIPRTVLVTRDNADALWAERRQLFFKPAAGFGSRAVYRGDKLTRRVWDEILAGVYVAQRLIAPSARRLRIADELLDLKMDVRSYVYEGVVQLTAARLYQGQTTNFRTAGGGFAPVFELPCSD
jgi:hypothetical protein